jgi:hypothetical protein
MTVNWPRFRGRTEEILGEPVAVALDELPWHLRPPKPRRGYAVGGARGARLPNLKSQIVISSCAARSPSIWKRKSLGNRPRWRWTACTSARGADQEPSVADAESPAVRDGAPAHPCPPVARAAFVTVPVVDRDGGELLAALQGAAVVAAAASTDATVAAVPAFILPGLHTVHATASCRFTI